MKNFMESLARSGQSWIVAIIWAAALTAVAGAAWQSSKFVASVRGSQEVTAVHVPSVSVENKPLTKPEYDQIADMIAPIYGTVTIKPDVAGITLVATDLSGGFPDWRSALLDVVQSVDGASWKVESMCVGAGCDQPAMVTLSAVRSVVSRQ